MRNMNKSTPKVVIIHGQSHTGSTCHVARELAEKLGGSTCEFFLPRDFGSFCTGCCLCLYESEQACRFTQPDGIKSARRRERPSTVQRQSLLEEFWLHAAMSGPVSGQGGCSLSYG